ncbi:SHOCT domain-containing protein [Allofranklinella schreckenbergeri]|uniref:SHOCT domain-containing protein n=1 Tax=Allofranklinella schreckenbergeri TaxID=1076744 RepID=A0A3M6Q8P9_9BURK|nr:SHOCT domain-containing protein [Allofranklinella schreckenbergeri]
MHVVIGAVFLLLLFCFLWGVGTLFGNAKEATERWSERRASQPDKQGPERPATPRQLAHAADVTIIENPPEAGNTADAQACASAPQESPMSAALAQLREADALREKGVITQAEFEKLKSQILNGVLQDQGEMA